MMQSRLAATAASKVHRLLVSAAISQDHQVIPPAAAAGRLASSISGGGRTADPAIHAVKPEEKDGASSTNQSEFKSATTKDEDPYVPPKSPSYPSSSPQIQSTGVNQPQGPIKQQKRHSTSTTTSSPAPVTQSTEGVSCAGLDGFPWPPPEGKREGEDDKEYFEHHKASPLSELKMVDTRKPITRATDGTADNYQVGYYGDTGVMVWRPEQLDTAEDSLRRATEIWKSNAMRGDPDSPHGRILRALRGEYW